MDEQLHQFQFKAMAAPCELHLFHVDRQTATQVANKVIAEVHRIEYKYSRYRIDNLMHAINQAGSCGGSIQVDEETAGLLNYADACYQQSDGLFDISSGVLRKVWDFKSATIPSQKQINEQLARVGWNKVKWQQPNLAFSRPDMELDFGGIGKEYAADRAATLSAQNGVQSGLIDLGGDIKIIGPRPDGRNWRVGIRDTRNPQAISGVFETNQGAVTTSGDYQRFMMIDGTRYCHILNPKTGWPTQSLAAVTVAADHCIVAGSACTIAMLKGQQGSDWLEQGRFVHHWVDINGQTGGNLTIKRPKQVSA